ncbi:hypothetical protein OYE22_11265 [Streptomyces sp. 71268]|uniref:hypothetical protein n=1 Tax=Streptomyces sp. 71268 TaxID=3002640 RepID=UPI0023F88068|nr:hypothetical protein [Streptomyces sp. 71268]WEV25715.1 hypothetical protein OYE22_11265 [Streptomyces sp. 71268]
MPHTMTLKVYRKRPGEEPVPLAPDTTVHVDPEALTGEELEAKYLPTAWGPCRCPRHRQGRPGE